MRQIKYVTKVLVENAVARVATSLPTLTAGEIGVFSTDGRLLDTTTVLNEDKIRIVTGAGGIVGGSTSTFQGLGDAIVRANVLQATAKVFTAQTQTLAYVGYDGATATLGLDVINDNPYQIFVNDFDSTTYGSTGQHFSAYYKSDATATQQEVADGLAASFAGVVQQALPRMFRAELVASSTSIASGATGTYATGSRTVATSASVVGTIAAGDYIRVGATGATTAPIYKVASVSTTAITLVNPYQGDSAAGVVTTYIAAATIQALTAGQGLGIRLLGLIQPFATNNTALAQEFYVAKFTVSTAGFTSTVVTQTRFASQGSGEPAAIAVLETSLLAEQGYANYNTWPPAVFPSQTNLAAAFGYAVINIKYNKDGGISPLNVPQIQNELIIAARQLSAPVTPAIISQAGGVVLSTGLFGTTGVLDVLTAWLQLPTPVLVY